MEFGEILDRWERRRRKEGPSVPDSTCGNEGRGNTRDPENAGAPEPSPGVNVALSAWLDSHGIDDKDAATEDPDEHGIPSRNRKPPRRPQARLDLHGMTAAQAEERLLAFLRESVAAGLETVIVVHGKGNHSTGGPVLDKLVRRVLESSRLAGNFGHAGREDGGSGATLVRLRSGNHFSR